jgi:hypothetical protein
MTAHPETHNQDRARRQRRKPASKCRANHELAAAAAKPPESTVPEIYEVVIECRHEEEQRAVYERMCGEGFRCRVMVL